MWLSACMVWFSFQGNSNAEEKIRNKKLSGSCIQVQIFFLNKYFTEVEELLAIKRIVLIMAFVIHSSIY